jgi:hypothetical protein
MGSDALTIKRKHVGDPPIVSIHVVGGMGSFVRAVTFAPDIPALQMGHNGHQVADFAFRDGRDLEAFANALLELAWQCIGQEA